jgi:hypothetical protein
VTPRDPRNDPHRPGWPTDELQEAAMHRERDHRRRTDLLSHAIVPLALIAAGLVATASPPGCAVRGPNGASAAQPDAGALAADADGAPAGADAAGDGRDSWETMIDRDLADLRAIRDRARARAGTAGPPGTPGPAPADEVASAPAAPAAPPDIQWNSRRRTVAADGPDEAEPPATTQPPLARDPAPDLAITAPAPPAGDDAADAPDATTPPPAVDPLVHDDLGVLLVDVRRSLNLRKSYSDQPLLELFAISSNPDAFNGLTDGERALLEKLQIFFTRIGSRLDADGDAEDEIVAAVEALRGQLVREPELELPNTQLCWRVGGFGDYDAFDRVAFLAHTEQQVILYLEVDRFTSEPNQKSQWVTELSQQLEIYSDLDGIPVWSEPWQKAVDVTNNRRRDFFTTQIITLPPALSVGRYHLKIRVRDEKSGAEAEASVPFEMVADPKLAGKVG